MRKHALKALAHSARGVGLAVVFASALVGGVVLHAGLGGFHRAAAEIGNRATASLFDGHIVIGQVDHLSIGRKSRVVVETVDIVDPEGKRVVHGDGVEAAIDLRLLLDSLLGGKGAVIELDSVRIRDADVVLDRAADGTLNIARTFHHTDTPKEAAAAAKTTTTTTKAQPYLDIAAARIAHAHVHGSVVPGGLDGETTQTVARVHLEHDTVRVDIDDGKAVLTSPHAPNQQQPVAAAVQGAISVELATTAISGHADATGSVGAVPLLAHAQISGDDVQASVDVARVETAPLGKAFTGLPFGRPVEAHATAHGTLPIIALEARARVGESDIVAKGDIDTREGHGFHLDATAGHVDVAAYGAPVASDVTTKVHSEGVLGGVGLGVIGTFRVVTEDGVIGDEKLPATTVDGHFEEQKITGTFRASEPGVDLSGNVDFDLPTFVADFDLQARSSSLRKISYAPKQVDGIASARARGKVMVLTKTIDATTTITGDALSFDSFSAAHIDANGHLHGPLAAPVLDLGFDGQNLALKAKGKTPLVYPQASGRAQIAFVPSVSIVSASINVGKTGDPDAIGAVATNITVANGVVQVHGVELTGLGEPLALDVSFGANGWNLKAKSDGVDLHRVAIMSGISELKVMPEGTRAALDIDVHDAPGGATGHFDIVVKSEKGALLGGGLVAETHGTIERGHLKANAKVTSEGLGELEISDAELDIPGRLDARSLERATGTIELRGSFDLAQGGAMFGGEKIEKLEGLASFEGRIERGDPDALPAIRATIKTKGLDVTYSEDPSKPSTKIAGIDVQTYVDWDGRTEDAELSFMTWDAHGILGNAQAKAKLPLAAWITGAKRFDRRAIADLDVDAVMDVPTRKIASLPEFLSIPEVRGSASARITSTGELAHPSVVISVRASELRTQRQRRGNGPPDKNNFEPLDGVLEARWDGYRGAITFALDEREPPRPPGMPATPSGVPQRDGPPPLLPGEKPRPKRAPGHVHGLVMLTDFRASDLLRGRAPGDLPWTAASEIEVDNLNLGALPLPVRDVTGALTGRVHIVHLNRAAEVTVTSHVDDFGVGGATVQALDVNGNAKDGQLFVKGVITDSKSSATAQFDSKSLKIDGLDVGWDDKAQSRLDYAVQNVSLALVAPLIRKQVSEIDGRVNGAGSVTIEGSTQAFEGGLDIRQTNLYVNVLGEEVSGLALTAKFDRSGTFTIDNASGKLGIGEFHAKANGHMKGFSFDSADVSITSPPKGPLPISSEGANFASASGEIKLNAKMSDDRGSLLVTLELPQDEVTLPDRSAQQLQPMDADKTIAIGVRKKDGKLDTTAVRKNRGGTGKAATDSTLVTKITATLGQKVHLQGRGLDITLGGKTFVQIAKEISVTGQIDIKSGTIEVHGRRFTLDHGVVTFPDGGDPGNPTVVAAAYWDAPDRTRVWVEFAGPLKSGKLVLRSEPAFSKNEILSILLFGQPDPNMATGGGAADSTGDASGATAVGSGFVAEDLNRMLSEIDNNLDIETDTLEGNRTRTKIGRTFFDQRLKVQVGYAPGQTYREPDSEYLFLNWQFIPKWSLVGTRGDKGTSILDVLFQHRY